MKDAEVREGVVFEVVLFATDGLRLGGGCPLIPVSVSGRWA